MQQLRAHRLRLRGEGPRLDGQEQLTQLLAPLAPVLHGPYAAAVAELEQVGQFAYQAVHGHPHRDSARAAREERQGRAQLVREGRSSEKATRHWPDGVS